MEKEFMDLCMSPALWAFGVKMVLVGGVALVGLLQMNKVRNLIGYMQYKLSTYAKYSVVRWPDGAGGYGQGEIVDSSMNCLTLQVREPDDRISYMYVPMSMFPQVAAGWRWVSSRGSAGGRKTDGSITD